ncbi:ABC transporter ATP-binding protein [Candidatus Saccharibacteria bacterium]|nr:ABC transporter ATP-binding protein [Candidatus Saccharibacteria bacterium]
MFLFTLFRSYYRYIRNYLALKAVSIPLFVLSLITALFYKGFNLSRPFIAALIIKSITAGDQSGAYFWIMIYCVVYILYRLTHFLNHLAYGWNVIYAFKNLQHQIFEKLISVDQNFTKKISKGRLMNTLNSDLIEIGEMNDAIAEFIFSFLQLGAVIFIIFTFDLNSAALILVYLFFCTVIRNQGDEDYNHYFFYTQNANDRFSNFMSQVLGGLSEVKTFNMFSKLTTKLDIIQESYTKAYKKQRQASARRDCDYDYLYYSILALLYVLLIYEAAQGIISVDQFVMVITYHAYADGFLDDFITAAKSIRVTSLAVQRVTEVLHYKPRQQVNFGNLELNDIAGRLELKNVSLSVERKPILKDISFTVRPHDVVAIVGYPGAGKTMLFNLILRLMRPTHGKILLDGVPIDNFSREVYTNNIAVANQAPFIFNMSIRKNLDFVDTNIKRQIEACKIAGVHDFIETLPQGYHTILRENAGNISGGQRQMVSIARTILTDAEILLLDDVTTSLDPDTALLVPRLLNRIRTTHTVIMITKKPDLMREATRIIVLDKGKIVASGTHEGLMKRCKLYRSLQTAVSPSANQTTRTIKLPKTANSDQENPENTPREMRHV